MLVAAAALGGYAITHHIRTQSASSPSTVPVSIPAAVRNAGATPSPSPSPPATSAAGPSEPGATSSATTEPARGTATRAGVAAALAHVLQSSSLGGRVLGSVVDTATGQAVYSRHASMTSAPASTAKVLTAMAALDSYSSDYRIQTDIVDGGDGTIVIVGAGDPTLSAAAPDKPTTYPEAGRLSDLVQQLRTAHVSVKRIVIDDSAFIGNSISTDWSANDVPSSYASGITAFMADGGRATPTASIRSAAPDVAAAHEFATLLGQPTLPVTSGFATPGAKTLASVYSAPLSVLVDQMLTDSDNVIAECLGRLVAQTKGAVTTFTGAAQAIRAVVSSLGVDPGGGMLDASGLAAADRLSPGTLTQALALILSGEQQELHPIVNGLPVAGWSGTLADRYTRGSSTAAGAGVIRAKTGTLTSVSTLAGLVHTADGGVLAFAFFADKVKPTEAGTLAAEQVLDQVATTLAHCGCGR